MQNPPEIDSLRQKTSWNKHQYTYYVRYVTCFTSLKAYVNHPHFVHEYIGAQKVVSWINRWMGGWVGEWTSGWMKKLLARVKQLLVLRLSRRQSCRMIPYGAPHRKGLCLSRGQCKTRPCSGKAVSWMPDYRGAFKLYLQLWSQKKLSWFHHVFTCEQLCA